MNVLVSEAGDGMKAKLNSDQKIAFSLLQMAYSFSKGFQFGCPSRSSTFAGSSSDLHGTKAFSLAKAGMSTAP